MYLRSGIEILVSEIDDLLQQIASLMKEYNNKKQVKNTGSKIKHEEKTSYEKGLETRQKACNPQFNGSLFSESLIGEYK